MLMGRPKIINTELPRRMRMKGKSYYHVYDGKWTALGSDKRIALIQWAEIEGRLEGQTFGEAMDKYFASNGFTKLSANTKRAYLSRAVTIREIFGTTQCSDIKPMHVYKYMNKLPSKAGANQGLVVIQKSFEMARIEGWIEVNPANDIKKHTLKGRGRYLTDAEYQAIYSAGTEVLKAIMKVAYTLGQRQIDILKLRLPDIAEEGVYITQQKTGKRQLFMWSEQLREAIDQAKAITRPVRGMTLFCNSKGKQYDRREFYYQWQAACRISGVEGAQFRDLRSKAATDAAELDGVYEKIFSLYLHP